MNLLETIFLWILYASFTATIIIFFVLFIKKIINNRLDLRINRVLWLLVIIRLLLPFMPQSPLSIFNIFPEIHKKMMFNQSLYSFSTVKSYTFKDNEINTDEVEKHFDLDSIENKHSQENDLSKQKLTAIENRTSTKNISLKGMLKIASCIWFSGFIAIILLIVVRGIIFDKKSRYFKKINDPEIVQILNLLKEKLKVNKDISLYYEENLRSPFIVGFINPKIYIPKELLKTVEKRELYYILLHELIHYKRKDLLYNLLETIALSIHWFNPAVWFAVKKMRLDKELTCDYIVLENIEEDEVKVYGLTILKLSRVVSNHIPNKIIPSYFYDNISQLERRIIMIKKFKKKSYKMSILLGIAFLLLGSFTLTNAQTNTAIYEMNSQNKEFNLGIPSQFNTLDRALDFVDFDFKLPDDKLKKYIFDSIRLYDDTLNVEFFARDVVDTSGFTLMISKKDFMEDIKKNPYKTYIDLNGVKGTKEVTIEPMTISNIDGMCITENTHYEWTEEAIKGLQKKNTKNTKYIPTIKNTVKYFMWKDDDVWYGVDYYFENISYSKDTSKREVSKEDLETILSSLTYTKNLKSMSYVSKAWKDTLYIYGNKDLKQVEEIIGFTPKFPLELTEKFELISSSTHAPCYLETEPWTQLESLFQKKDDSNSKIKFVQTKSTHRYDFLEKNGYDRETEVEATTITQNNINIFTFKGKDEQFYLWKKNDIIYIIEFVGECDNKENILDFLIDEAPCVY